MERLKSVLATILILITGCENSYQRGADDLIIVDVTANYPKKEVILQDILDVEYIPLETNDDFVTQGYLRAISNDHVVSRNYLGDGDIYIFDINNGKGLKKINRKGSGAEEYINITDMLLEEETNQLLLSDIAGNKIIWYDLDGNFIHSFGMDKEIMYRGIYNFDPENFIAFNAGRPSQIPDEEPEKIQSFLIISKQDGHLDREIEFVFDKKKSMFLIGFDPVTRNPIGGAFMEAYTPVVPYQGNFILTELSSDTIFSYSTDHQLTPWVVRTPSIQTMDPEVYLLPTVLTDRYYFMLKLEKIWDFENGKGFPVVNIMYDRDEKALYECHVYNRDFTDKRLIEMRYKFGNDKVAFLQVLEAPVLMEAYEEGKLTGRLKEIAANMDEESNPVLLLGKRKTP